MPGSIAGLNGHPARECNRFSRALAASPDTRSIRGGWPVDSRNFTRSSRAIEVVMVLTSGWALMVACSIRAASSTTVTRPCGVVDGAERRDRAGRHAEQFAHQIGRAEGKPAAGAEHAGAGLSGRSRRLPAPPPGTPPVSCPCRNRFLVWPPGICAAQGLRLLDREQRRMAHRGVRDAKRSKRGEKLVGRGGHGGALPAICGRSSAVISPDSDAVAKAARIWHTGGLGGRYMSSVTIPN